MILKEEACTYFADIIYNFDAQRIAAFVTELHFNRTSLTFFDYTFIALASHSYSLFLEKGTF